jgi:flagellin-like hook-associated protein FlgL
MEKALQNVSDAKSMLDVVENAYNSIIDNLIKLKSLATQAASGTIATGSDEMAYLASQMEAIGDEINDIADKTKFNGKNLIGSSENDTFSIQTGEDNSGIMDIGLSEISMKTIFPFNSLVYPNSSNYSEDFNDGDISDQITDGNASINAGSFDGTNYLSINDPTGDSNMGTTNLNENYGTYSFDVKTNDNTSNIRAKVADSGNNWISIDLRPSNSDDPSVTLNHKNDLLPSLDIGDPNFNWGTWVNAKLNVDSEYAELFVNNESLAKISVIGTLDKGKIELGGDGNISYDNILFSPIDPNNERLIIDEDTVTDSDMRNLMNNIDTALENMNSKMNELGINQRSLSSKEENLTQAITANSAAESRIMDTDFAKEQSNSIRLQILQQTATAALSQANMGPQAVLGFLGQ